MEEWFQALNWINDLGVEAARKRGLVRLRTGAALLIIGIVVSFVGAPAAGGLAALVGAVCIPCAAVELLTNKSWVESSRIMRLLFLVLSFPLSIAFFAIPIIMSVSKDG